MTIVMKPKSSDLDLSGAVLPRVNLSRTNLSGANLETINLSGADLSQSNLMGARLKGAILQGANLSNADFSEADLSGANLIDATLDGANFRKTNLRGANLKDAKGVGWQGLLQAFLDERTILPAELQGDSLFRYLEQNIYSDRSDWRSEFNGSYRDFLRQMSEKAERIGHGFTIYALLTTMASRETRDHRILNIGFREDNDR